MTTRKNTSTKNICQILKQGHVHSRGISDDVESNSAPKWPLTETHRVRVAGLRLT